MNIFFITEAQKYKQKQQFKVSSNTKVQNQIFHYWVPNIPSQIAYQLNKNKELKLPNTFLHLCIALTAFSSDI